MKKIIIGLSIITLLASCKKETITNSSDSSETKTSTNLASWSDASKSRIETWVKEVTDSTSANFIPVADRIAVFDNDGTLWTEQPVLSTQFIFAIDNLKTLSKSNPDLLKDPVLKGVVNGDFEPLKKAGIPGILKLINTTHNNNQTETEFDDAVKKWMTTAKDTKFNKTYSELIYLPMVELLNYLRANQFKTFIVSGGGADFMRAFAEETYGIPPYQIIGSYGEAKYEIVDGKPIIRKISGAPFIDDKEGKPVAIHRFIGKVPVFCAGNSDGDQAMLQYTSGSKYKSFGMILHHTDSIREYAYDSKSYIGHLESALVEAKEKNWMVVDMKNDFKKIFSFQ
ncbi:haloacid dehalogenase-like hydrolase [Flavobacterium sp. GA093]|uniref:Haloacid dehalogenase-like hydrolase n=1 Tax=Flavobacterium hydrocarbonoxydans TaxID=2683249 RepID=A0A6I4NS74_9FLAO|nr:HAD family hydrolase [Flavobacterium hydrocarbonoxydans]MWB95345.1 haloacid dehalogenase-like hydrolase [Flavobacterium hydrocarbonoxydans]